VTLPAQPTPSAGQPAATPQVQPTTALYSSPEEAVRSLKDDYFYWTGKLTESSFALSLAVIGANWAVFGTVDKILTNIWAELSIAAVILSLIVSLIGSGWLGRLLRQRIKYAEKDQMRWQKQYENADKSKHWPSTKKIDSWAGTFRVAKILLPVTGGVFFLFAFFIQAKAQKDRPHSGLSAFPTPAVLSAPSPSRTSTSPSIERP
jgi:hypothetical protein